MTHSFKQRIYLISGFVFLAVFALALTRFSGYFMQFTTLVIVAGSGLIFYLAGIRWSFHVVLFTLPLSMNLPLSGDHQLMFPSELLIVAFGISVVLHWIRNAAVFTDWLKHPLTLLFGGYVFFLMISLFFSEMLIVSLKSVIIKILYLVTFYGGAFLYFRNSGRNVTFMNYYLVPLLVVVGIVLVKHYHFSFANDVTGYLTKPFYQDHTIYSAALSFALPLVMLQAWNSKDLRRVLFTLMAVLLATALFLAASRAAWLSIGMAAMVWFMIKLKVSPKGFALVFAIGTLFIFFKSDELVLKMKSNRFDSGARNAGIEEQTKSVVNITNDQSNAERINRWKCALRMFREKPYTGFGPGTYQFAYFPFQREIEMTRISVKSPYNIKDGKGGTAHNEFLLVLAESGAGAAFFFLGAVLLTFFIAITACFRSAQDGFPLAMMLAFTTFVVHSLFNNFLDTDKTAALFFSAIAFFASLNKTRVKQQAHEG